MFNKRDQSGQSLVEILVAAFILGLLAIALAGIAVVGTKTVLVSEQRTVAQAIANKKIELIKITPYLDVGLNDASIPTGIFSPTETISQNNQDYVVKISVELIDDPVNGCLGNGGLCDGSNLDEDNADFKKVVVSVKYPAADVVTKEVKVSALSIVGQAASLLNLVGCDPTDTTGSCGAGQRCCNQLCLPTCEPGTAPAGYRCASGGCGYELDIVDWQDEAECFNDFQCAAEATNKQCLEGKCEPLCAIDDDCPSLPVQESCINDFCEAPCSVNAECAGDKLCVDGSCQPVGCLDNTYCGTGYNCIDFQCVPTACTADNECPPAYECTEGACMPTPCNANNCPGDWSCVSGLCQPPQCNAPPPRQECNNTDCVQTECQPTPPCSSHDQCQGDAVCLAGVCDDPPVCPPACPGVLQCEAGLCINPSRKIVPLKINTSCPAPISLPCMPAIGEATITWLPAEGQNYCTPILTTSECTTSFYSNISWSDIDDPSDGITNCGINSGPTPNECIPSRPIECGTSFGGIACPGGQTCLEGRCFEDAACGGGFTDHPTITGACVKEWGVVPTVVCPPSCSGSTYCSIGQCVTAGCETDEQCSSYGDYMCRNLICIPKKALDCSYCPPPENRITYCMGLDCDGCDGGVGTECPKDRFEKTSVVVEAQDEATGCIFLTCSDAPAECGDGIVQVGEDCDTAGAGCPVTGNTCDPIECTCPAPSCGNDVLEAGEVCDGTDDTACPGLCGTGGVAPCVCPVSWPEPSCNNGIVEPGEICDPLAVPNGCPVGSYCESDCATCFLITGGPPLPEFCGDGIIDLDEQCDYIAGPTGCAGGDTCELDCLCYGGSPIP